MRCAIQVTTFTVTAFPMGLRVVLDLPEQLEASALEPQVEPVDPGEEAEDGGHVTSTPDSPRPRRFEDQSSS